MFRSAEIGLRDGKNNMVLFNVGNDREYFYPRIGSIPTISMEYDNDE